MAALAHPTGTFMPANTNALCEIAAHRNTSGRADFDFLYGRWSVTSHRLTALFSNADSWDTFEGYATSSGHLDGLANIDEIRFPTRGLAGMSIRLYDIDAAAWRIRWVCNGDGLLRAPLAGRFETAADGRRIGVFTGEDMDGSRSVKARVRWIADEIAPRWEQAWSLDNGLSWETNWRMDFTRVR